MDKCIKTGLAVILAITPVVSPAVFSEEIVVPNHTYSLIQFGIDSDKTPAASVYVRGVYGTMEQCYSALLDVGYIFELKKNEPKRKIFGITESMHGLSMVVCSLNVGVDIKQ